MRPTAMSAATRRPPSTPPSPLVSEFEHAVPVLDDPGRRHAALGPRNQLATTLLALLTLAPAPARCATGSTPIRAPREPAAALFDTWQTAPARAGQNGEPPMSRHASLDADIEAHLRAQPAASFAAARTQFLADGIALISFVLPQAAKDRLAVEVRALAATAGRRRDLRITHTGHTPRRLRAVPAATIREHDGEIAALYLSASFQQALRRITGEKVLPCPYLPEQYVITQLEHGGDTHGWHWDDYSFAAVLVVDCPPLEDGGFLQCAAGTSWNKSHPAIFRTLVDHPIRSYNWGPAICT